MNNTPVLLDTHIWVWLMNGDETLKSSGCLIPIERAAADNNVFISIISVWEIGMLESKGRISFSENVSEWIKKSLTAPGIRLVPITPETALQSSRLPGNFHGDPADRIIVATARETGANLVTRDRKIIEYGNMNYINVIRA